MTAYFDDLQKKMSTLRPIARLADLALSESAVTCPSCGRQKGVSWPPSSDRLCLHGRTLAEIPTLSAHIDCLEATVARLKAGLPTTIELNDHLNEIEAKIIRDVQLTTVLPDFPRSIAQRIDRIFLRYVVEARPLLPNLRPAPGPEPEPEGYDDRVTLLADMADALHTAFHDLARESKGKFSDKPYDGERALLARAEERLEDEALSVHIEAEDWTRAGKALAVADGMMNDTTFRFHVRRVAFALAERRKVADPVKEDDLVSFAAETISEF